MHGRPRGCTFRDMALPPHARLRRVSSRYVKEPLYDSIITHITADVKRASGPGGHAACAPREGAFRKFTKFLICTSLYISYTIDAVKLRQNF